MFNYMAERATFRSPNYDLTEPYVNRGLCSPSSVSVNPAQVHVDVVYGCMLRVHLLRRYGFS